MYASCSVSKISFVKKGGWTKQKHKTTQMLYSLHSCCVWWHQNVGLIVECSRVWKQYLFPFYEYCIWHISYHMASWQRLITNNYLSSFQNTSQNFLWKTAFYTRPFTEEKVITIHLRKSYGVGGKQFSFLEGAKDAGEAVFVLDKSHLTAVDRVLTCVGFQAFTWCCMYRPALTGWKNSSVMRWG